MDFNRLLLEPLRLGVFIAKETALAVAWIIEESRRPPEYLPPREVILPDLPVAAKAAAWCPMTDARLNACGADSTAWCSGMRTGQPCWATCERGQASPEPVDRRGIRDA